MQKGRPMTVGVLLFLLTVSLGIGARAQIHAEKAGQRLRQMYDGAILSAQRQMEDMQLSLSKALLSRDAGEEAHYLSQVTAGAGQVQRSLSLLPLSHTATQAAVKFANQAGDYAGTLLKNETLTEEDAARLDEMIGACDAYAKALAQARDELSAKALSGEESFYPLGEKMEKNYDSAVSYPTLIYDGPFSDARETSAAKGLPKRRVTQEEALGIARDFVGADRVAAVAAGAEMGGSIPCWGVEIRLSDLTLHAAVSKDGGKVIWMAPDSADFAMEKSLEECRASALSFLSRNGYDSMTPTYFQCYQGVMVISFAATQGSTVLYPDLVKVQLRMDTAQAVGVETRGYWLNHAPRPLLVPEMTREEAEKNVSPRLQISSCRLCLIPSDSGEKLCYEFQGVYGEYTYLTYINALDGRQEELLKVVEGESGLEAV